MDVVDLQRLYYYTAAIRAIIVKPSKFTAAMNCVIYYDKHSFNKFFILLHMAYLKKHFTTYFLIWNCTQKQRDLFAKGNLSSYL